MMLLFNALGQEIKSLQKFSTVTFVYNDDKIFHKAHTTALTSYISLYPTLNNCQVSQLSCFKHQFQMSTIAVQLSPLCKACSAPQQFHCVSFKIDVMLLDCEANQCDKIGATVENKSIFKNKAIYFLFYTFNLFVKIWRGHSGILFSP